MNTTVKKKSIKKKKKKRHNNNNKIWVCKWYLYSDGCDTDV